MMDLKLKDLNFSPKGLKHITKYLAKKRNIAVYKSLMMNYYVLLKIKTINNKKE